MSKEEIKEALRFIAYTIIGVAMFFCLWSISVIFNV
jgi:hypothetical protein